MPSAARELEAAMSVLAGRALLASACTVLARESIVPVVLKGALLSALTEGSGAAPRAMIDVDVLVRAHERSAAVGALVASGLLVVAETLCATTLRDASAGLDLDLHARLVEPELFRLDAEEIVDRSTVDHDLFGFAVRVPDRHDLYAHLVAHFARGRSNASDRRRLRDFAVVAAALPMDARTLAAHLDELGLARAARYALGLAGDPFALEVLASLPPDRAGERVVRIAGSWLARFGGSSPLATPALHLLNQSLSAGARSFAHHSLRGAVSRTRRVLEGPPKRR